MWISITHDKYKEFLKEIVDACDKGESKLSLVRPEENTLVHEISGKQLLKRVTQYQSEKYYRNPEFVG